MNSKLEIRIKELESNLKSVKSELLDKDSDFKMSQIEL